LALLDPRRGPVVWAFTALVRVLVGAFVIARVASGELVMNWLVVAATDLLVAVVQCWGLKAGWWEEAGR
jgi:hypothetical protein